MVFDPTLSPLRIQPTDLLTQIGKGVWVAVIVALCAITEYWKQMFCIETYLNGPWYSYTWDVLWLSGLMRQIYMSFHGDRVKVSQKPKTASFRIKYIFLYFRKKILHVCKYTYIYGKVPKRGREWLLGAEEPGKGQDSYYYCKSVSIFYFH